MGKRIDGKWTRRDALRLAAVAAAGAVSAGAMQGESDERLANRSARAPGNGPSKKHGAPAGASHAALEELRYGSVKPEGWLKVQLQKQRDGLTGHLREIFPPFTGDAWSKDEMNAEASWVPWENMAYWCDGAVRCAIALDDEQLLAQARKLIDFTLAHPGSNGYLGPAFLEAPGDFHRWPHAVFFRGVLAWQDATGDRAPLDALTRHYLDNDYRHTHYREEINIEPMLLLYARTGDRRLLEKAVATWDAFQHATSTEPDFRWLLEKEMLSPGPVPCHGVTYAEHTKLPALLYMHTGEPRYLELAVNAQRKVFEHHMLVDGTPSSTERLTSTSARDGHETCDTTDYAWNWGYLLMATGRGAYSDRIERATFNAGMGAVKPDWRALQYYSCPNQFLCTADSDHLAILKGVTPDDIREYRYMQRMSYRPSPGFNIPCCPGNVNRFLPNYLGRMWMRDARDGGLAATLYGPCRVKARVGAERETIEIVEETSYPFSEEIRFRIAAERAVEFTLHLRVPGWCEKPAVMVNGSATKAAANDAGFVTVTRRFMPGDVVTLKLPMQVATSTWPDNGLAVERGPLVYALPIAGKWEHVADDLSTRDFPAWDLTPAGEWNYALVAEDVASTAKVKAGEASQDPWTDPPVILSVDARRVKDWELTRIRDAKRDWTFTPALPDPVTLPEKLDSAMERVTLVPYGSTQLRLTVFPTAVRPGSPDNQGGE
jgi:DUF1680 family protein